MCVCVGPDGTPHAGVSLVDCATLKVVRYPIGATAGCLSPRPAGMVAALWQGGELAVYDMDKKTKLGSQVVTEDVVFLCWSDARTVALVTASAVFHWTGKAALTKAAALPAPPDDGAGDARPRRYSVVGPWALLQTVADGARLCHVPTAAAVRVACVASCLVPGVGLLLATEAGRGISLRLVRLQQPAADTGAPARPMFVEALPPAAPLPLPRPAPGPVFARCVGAGKDARVVVATTGAAHFVRVGDGGRVELKASAAVDGGPWRGIADNAAWGVVEASEGEGGRVVVIGGLAA